MSEYPEHEKLKAVQPQNEYIGEFLEFLESKGIVLCRWHERRRDEHELREVYKTKERWIADFYNIDLEKIESEKQEMLKEMTAN